MSWAYPPADSQIMRRCLRCGTPLPPDGTICVNCGMYNAFPQNGWGRNQGQFRTHSQQQPQPTSQEQQQWAAQGQHIQAPSGPLGGNSGMPAAASQGQSIGWNQAPATGSQPSQQAWPAQTIQPLAQYQSFPLQPAHNSFVQGTSGADGYYQVSQVPWLGGSSDYFPAQEEQEGLPVGRIVLFALLALLIIGGGLAGIFYLNGQKQGSTTASPTFVITTPTTKPLFSDTFMNDKAGWPLSSVPGVSFERVGGGLMTIEDDNNRLQWEILPGKTFADFRLDIDATLTKGDPSNAYGVYIRGSSTANSPLGTYYRLELYGDGTFAAFKGALDSNGNTIDEKITYQANAAILTEGHTNHITIIAKGSAMTFMVNGVTIEKYSDTAYRGGLIALFVSNLPGLPKGAQATFAKLAIFPPG